MVASRLGFKALILGSLVILGSLIPLFCFGATILEENFENYELGELAGKGNWLKWGTSTGVLYVENTEVFEGIKAVKFSATTTTPPAYYYKIGNLIASGTQIVYFKIHDIYNVNEIIFSENWGAQFLVIFNHPTSPGTIQFFTGSLYYYISTYVPDEWFSFQTQWRDSDKKVRFRMNEENWTDWWSVPSPWDLGLNRIDFYFDWLPESEGVVMDYIAEIPKLTFSGKTPPDETEITNINTDFTFSWTNFNPEIWKGVIVSFREETTGIHTKGIEYTDLATSGEKILSLFNFDFDKNSRYCFHAIAFGEKLELIQGTFLTPHGYIEYFSEDLVSPEYCLNINIPGLPVIFEMPIWDIWYAENTEYETSTPLFSAVAGFLDPTFSKLGEFGSRVVSYLNLDDAYQKGQGLGIIFPIFNQYIELIEPFFGGFPIIRFSLVIIFLLLGFFVFKLILKFIPFFGK